MVIVEAASEEEARAQCANLSLVKVGLLRCDFSSVKAFRAIKVAADRFSRGPMVVPKVLFPADTTDVWQNR